MNNTLVEIVTPEMRAQLAANSVSFKAAVDEVLKEFGVKFTPGLSLSKMVKESTQYPPDSNKKAQGQFFNRVKSACKAYKLGEALTVEAVINRNFWVRFNGSTVDKTTGNIKTIGVTLVDSSIKASSQDENVQQAIENKKVAEETAKAQKALAYFKSKYSVTDEELANAISANVTE